MSNQKDVDAIIVGASLAGAATAIQLGKSGFTVAIFDKADFPRHKPCGEGLSHLAFPLLEDLGIPRDSLLNIGHRFYGYTLFPTKEHSRLTNPLVLNQRHVRGIGISRSDLDALLISQINTIDLVSLCLKQKVTAIDQTSSGWSVQSTNQRISSPILIIASGGHSRHLIKPHTKIRCSQERRVSYSLQAHIRHEQFSDSVRVAPFSNGEIYITSLSNSLANISFVGTIEFLSQFRDRQKIEEIINSIFALSVRITGHGAGASNFCSRIRSKCDNLFLVGDACESFDPACGLGMMHALATAKFTANGIASHFTGSLTIGAAQTLYMQRQRHVARRIRILSQLIRFFLGLYQRHPKTLRGSKSALLAFALQKTDHLITPHRQDKT